MTENELLQRWCPWMIEARRLLGSGEIPGPKTAGFIAAMLKGLNAWWRDDETPWCGVFVAHCLKTVGLPVAKQWWRARGWEGFGQALPRNLQPRDIPYGALVVLDRPPSKSNGHVGFCAGRAEFSTSVGVTLLGGNQGTKEHPTGAVSYASFPRSRVVYWCWPTPTLLPSGAGSLLVGLTNGLRPVPASRGEA